MVGIIERIGFDGKWYDPGRQEELVDLGVDFFSSDRYRWGRGSISEYIQFFHATVPEIESSIQTIALALSNKIDSTSWPCEGLLRSIRRLTRSLWDRVDYSIYALKQLVFGWGPTTPLSIELERSTLLYESCLGTPQFIAHARAETSLLGPLFHAVMDVLTFGLSDVVLPIQLRHLFDDHLQFRFCPEEPRHGEIRSQWLALCQKALAHHRGFVQFEGECYNLRYKSDYLRFLVGFCSYACDDHLEMASKLPGYSEAIPTPYRWKPVTLDFLYNDCGGHDENCLRIFTNSPRPFVKALNAITPEFVQRGLPLWPNEKSQMWLYDDRLSHHPSELVVKEFCHTILTRHGGLVKIEKGGAVYDIATQEGYAAFFEAFEQKVVELWHHPLNGWQRPQYEEAVAASHRYALKHEPERQQLALWVISPGHRNGARWHTLQKCIQEVSSGEASPFKNKVKRWRWVAPGSVETESASL